MPASRMYFLNTKYIEVVAHSDANLTVVSGDDMEGGGFRPVNQDASVIPILWMGNMTISNRSLMGVLKA